MGTDSIILMFMKKWTFSLILFFLPLAANADAVEIDGIYYNLSTSPTNTAEVTWKYGFHYSGDVVIPESIIYEDIQYVVTTIRANAFENCSYMTSIKIPSSLTSVGRQAFNGCSGLTAVYITDLESWCNISFEGDYANPLYLAHHIYLNSAEIRDLVIPDGVSSINDHVFVGGSYLTSIKIPTSVTYLGTYSFSDCTGVTSVNIPNSVTATGYGVFRGCTGLTSVTIPNSITTIEGTLLAECSNLKSVTIPSSVTSIGARAFWKCSKLEKVYCLPQSVPSTGYDVFTFANIDNVTLYVLDSSLDLYQAANPWNSFNEIAVIDYDEVSISASKIRTYSSTYDLDFTDVSGLSAYVVSDFNVSEGTLTLSAATTVQAGEGLLLKGDAGDYSVPRISTCATYSNYLVGVPTTTSVSPTDGDYTNFILANGSHGINFYVLSKTGNITAGKAYLQLPTAALNQMSLSKGFSIIGGLTSITNIGIEKNNSEIFYDLQGRRVEKPTKGLYILNGKKVIIK